MMFTLLGLQGSESPYGSEPGRACDRRSHRIRVAKALANGYAEFFGDCCMVREKRGPLLLHQLRRSRMNNQTENDRHRTSRNFPQDRCSHVCRREHDRSLRHQRLSLHLIAGDYKNMGCRGELTSGVAKGIDAHSTRCRRRTHSDAPGGKTRGVCRTRCSGLTLG